MTHQNLWIVALWLLGGLALYECCGIPPTVEFGTVRIKDEDDTVLALYACNSGYTLKGEIEIYCDPETGKWNTDAPICVKIESDDDGDENNEENDINAEDTNTSQQTSQERKKKTQEILEDQYITADYAQNLDMSCVSARIKAPEIPDGFVQKYDRRRKGESTFIVAFYSCNDNFELQNSQRNIVYCSKRTWIGELPKCIAMGDYNEEEYEEYDDGAEEEEDEDEDEEEEAAAVARPTPPTSATTAAEAEVQYTVKVSEEVPDADADANEVVTPKMEVATDVNFVVQPTVDPYTPRVLNQSCGPDKGGCDHNCEMVLYPGENEPRVVCSCYSGFTLDPYNYRQCHDIDECIVNNGGCEQTCKNIPGSFECSCQEGLQIDTATGNTCIDINECESADIAAQCPGGCENTVGSYTCLPKPTEETRNNEVESVPNPTYTVQCEEGFRQSSDGNCVDIDECAEGIAKCQNCRNNHGSYDCICPSGFELSDDEATCVDVNECEAYAEEEGAPAVCSHECENTQGSFVCKCPDLFHLSDDRRTCVKDSCQGMGPNRTQCSYYCEESAEGPVCKCPERFQLAEDKFTCIPTAQDACLELGGNERCLPGSCNNLDDGSYKCSCPAGYRDEVYFCKDIDECSESKHTCSHICFNTEGSFVCQCPIGFQVMEGNSSSCVDIDECSDKDGVCGERICKNTVGGFSCVCPDGSDPDQNDKCVKDDLCSDNNGGCSHTCSSLEDRAVCLCPEDMKLSEDGFTCVHLDPCANNNNGCSQVCNKLLQGACSCEPGFELQEDGKSCRDYDECIENNGGCEHICVNKPGSFSCACDAGFELKEDLRTCTDVDECSQSLHDCSHYCVNKVGGYDCTCPAGFVLGPNQRTCIDVDECLGYSSCSHSCRNTLGSFECECPSGMVLDDDKKTCVNGDFCSRLQPQCSHFCNNVDNGFECSCPQGLKIGSDSLTCVDIDECLVDNAGCSHTCTNLEGSYSCLCPAGFKLGEDGKICQDVNECDVDNGGCEHYCINAKGRHSCECSQGFALQEDGRTCRESDPCRQNPGGCEHLCLSDGKCGCRPGYVVNPFNSSSCYDINECQVGNPCPGQSCRNTPGSYECYCEQGYASDTKGRCVDIDECEFQNAGCPGECVNLPGSYECKCPRGLRPSEDRKTCIKIRDQCHPFRPPKYGEIHCTRSRHRTHMYYKTRCSVWCTPGYQLEGPAVRHCSASGQWDNFENRCVPQMCPRLPRAEHGTILPANCLLGKTYVGERCLLHCHPGYMPAGLKVNVCNVDQRWSFNSTFDCIPIGTPIFNAPHERVDAHRRYGVPQPRPFIKCPRNTTVLLPLGHKTAHIILQKPKTNMDYRYVQSFPAWSRNLQAHLGAGVHVITFRGHEPTTRRGALCRTVITVKNSEPPKVTFCPPSFEVTLASAQEKRSIVWKEPEFESPSRIRNIQKSNIPGQLFSEGVHRISYEAFDEDGLTARCEFNVVVKAPQLQSMPYTSYGYPSQASERSSKLLANHDSYIICTGQAPVKIYGTQSINLPPGCVIKNVRINPLRQQQQYMRRRLITHRWTPFSSF
ncbi:fibrillin-2 isoform X2 [Eupeodes corollae]|uniref:fibrillin-2 isoform X2 n=1 Tax=Eupeodes corollae TaxID=290404 RepID=UPI00249128A3|nr:fibrillin-2 isoform X2 [Eupeodes corollae]